MTEIYVSTDIETDGPVPGENSILSFASAAFKADKTMIATFSANLVTLPGSSPHPVTEKWWKSQPEAWQAHRQDLQNPKQAMKDYVEWVKALPGKPVFVALPVSFDFTYMHWYMTKFVQENPFHHRAIDID